MRSGSVGARASRKARETRIRPGSEKPAIVAPVATLSPARHGSPRSSAASRIGPWSTPIRRANGSPPSPRASAPHAPRREQGLGRRGEDRDREALRRVGHDAVRGVERRDRADDRGVEPLPQGGLLGDGLAREVDEAEEHQARVRGVAGGVSHGRSARYLTRMPGCAPESGETRKMPGPSPEAASTMPSETPNFILRGARLATHDA